MMTLKAREEMALEFGVYRKTSRVKLKVAEINLPDGLVFPPWQKIILETFWLSEGVEPQQYAPVTFLKYKGRGSS
jgi:hypothetical protein